MEFRLHTNPCRSSPTTGDLHLLAQSENGNFIDSVTSGRSAHIQNILYIARCERPLRIGVKERPNNASTLRRHRTQGDPSAHFGVFEFEPGTTVN